MVLPRAPVERPPAPMRPAPCPPAAYPRGPPSRACPKMPSPLAYFALVLPLEPSALLDPLEIPWEPDDRGVLRFESPHHIPLAIRELDGGCLLHTPLSLVLASSQAVGLALSLLSPETLEDIAPRGLFVIAAEVQESPPAPSYEELVQSSEGAWIPLSRHPLLWPDTPAHTHGRAHSKEAEGSTVGEDSVTDPGTPTQAAPATATLTALLKSALGDNAPRPEELERALAKQRDAFRELEFDTFDTHKLDYHFRLIEEHRVAVEQWAQANRERTWDVPQDIEAFQRALGDLLSETTLGD